MPLLSGSPKLASMPTSRGSMPAFPFFDLSPPSSPKRVYWEYMHNVFTAKERTMPWYRVMIIDEPNPEAVKIVRANLLERFCALYREAGEPEDAAVYYR